MVIDEITCSGPKKPQNWFSTGSASDADCADAVAGRNRHAPRRARPASGHLVATIAVVNDLLMTNGVICRDFRRVWRNDITSRPHERNG